MPIPKPKKGEEKQAFISRCIETLTKEKSDEFVSREQRAAVCYSQWGEYEKESGMAVDEPKKKKSAPKTYSCIAGVEILHRNILSNHFPQQKPVLATGFFS